MADLADGDQADWPAYDPLCTLCIVHVPHAHHHGRLPLWPCVHCHNGQHEHCDAQHPDGPRQFCSCGCGLKEPST